MAIRTNRNANGQAKHATGITEWSGTIWEETALKAVNRQEWDMLKNAYAGGLAYGTSIRDDEDD